MNRAVTVDGVLAAPMQLTVPCTAIACRTGEAALRMPCSGGVCGGLHSASRSR